jgi:hypothetical protein
VERLLIISLTHCDIARELWTMVCLFRIQWVMCRSVIDLLACWQGQFGGHQSIGIWNARSLSHVVHMEKKKWRELRSA